MTSLLFGTILFLYALAQIAFVKGARFYIDAVAWAFSWGALFLANGFFGGPYIQSDVTNTLMFIYVGMFLLGHQVSIAGTGGPLAAKPFVPRIALFVIVCCLVGMAAPYELLKHGGADLGAVAGTGSYGDLASSIGGEVKTGLIEQSMLGKIAFAAPQAALVLLGIYMVLGNFKPWKRVVLSLIAASPLVAYTIVSTLRSATLLAIVLLMCSTVAALLPTGKEKELFRGKWLLSLLGVGVFLALVAVIFGAVRAKNSASEAGKTLEHLRIWVAGNIPGFNGWLWNTWDGHLGYGTKMFKFLASLVGGQSSFVETVQSDIYIGNQSYGNDNTMFRLVVNDFGLFGAAIFLFCWGVLSRLLLTRARRGSMVALLLFACNLAAVVYGPIGWWYSYGSRVMGPAIALCYVAFRHFFPGKGVSQPSDDPDVDAAPVRLPQEAA